MNRVFYIFFVVVIVAIIVFINNSASNNENSIEIDVTEKDIALEAKTKSEPEPFVAQIDSNIELTVNEACIINKGVIQTTGCKKFKNIEKMNLSQYTNLKLHDDVLIMFEKAELINPFNFGLILFELGVSDQGKVYQFIMHNQGEAPRVSKERYFFNSAITDYSIIVLESEFNFVSNIKLPLYAGSMGAFVNINNDSPYKNILSEMERCVTNWQVEFLQDNFVDITQINICDADALEAVDLINMEDYSNVEYLGQDVVLDGGGLILRENGKWSNIESCLFEGEYTLAKSLEINPLNITDLQCMRFNLEELSLIESFSNLEILVLRQLVENSEFSFISQLKKLKLLGLYSNSESPNFNLTELSDLSELTNLTVNGMNITNSKEFYSDNLQLSFLNLKKSNIDSLDFLINQDNLQTIDLSFMGIKEFPIIKNPKYLKSLILNNNNLTDIDGFENFYNLETLNLNKNKIVYMSNLNLDSETLKEVNINFNPLDCDDPYLNYSPKVKSSCNRALKPKSN